MTAKLHVPYEHDSGDTAPIWLATCRGTPTGRDWSAAYRDVVDGQRVVWIRTQATPSRAWLRDAHGVRRVRPLTKG